LILAVFHPSPGKRKKSRPRKGKRCGNPFNSGWLNGKTGK
jgi:hypothetical protein